MACHCKDPFPQKIRKNDCTLIREFILNPLQQSVNSLMDIFHRNVFKAIRLVKGRRFTLFKKFLFTGGTGKIPRHHFLLFHGHIRTSRFRASRPKNSQDRNPDHCRKVHHSTVIANEQLALSNVCLLASEQKQYVWSRYLNLRIAVFSFDFESGINNKNGLNSPRPINSILHSLPDKPFE